MFEDSTFESAGRIRTGSRRWMIASSAFYASIVLACVMIPLMFPEALPILCTPILIPAPAPLSNPQTPKPATAQAPATQPTPTWTMTIPTVIPRFILTPSAPEPQIETAQAEPDGIPGGISTVLPLHTAPRVVQPPTLTRLRISSVDEEVRLIHQTKPAYPPIALVARVQGTVVLAATISKTGSIENLRVTSGPGLLQQAALDAVETWRYQPYVLDGVPVEVETTVSVTFTLGR
jgi:protein TonB